MSSLGRISEQMWGKKWEFTQTANYIHLIGNSQLSWDWVLIRSVKSSELKIIRVELDLMHHMEYTKQALTWAWKHSSSSCSRWWRRSGSGTGWAAAHCCRMCRCSWRPCRNPSPLCSGRSTGWPMTCCGVGRWEVCGGEGVGWRRGRWRRGVRGR